MNENQIDPNTGLPYYLLRRGLMSGGGAELAGQRQGSTSGSSPQSQPLAGNRLAPITPEMKAAAGQNWAEQQAGLEQVDRMPQAFEDAAKGYAKKGIMGLGMSQLTGMPFDPGSIVSPTSVLGNVSNAVYNQMGLDGQKGFSFSDPSWEGAINTVINKGAPILGMMTAGPGGALAAKTLSTPFADMVNDAFGTRANDQLRDDLEDSSGEMRGRRQYADATQGIGPLNFLENAKSFQDAMRTAEQAFYTAQTDEEKTSALQQMQAFKQLNDVMTYNQIQKSIDPSMRENAVATVKAMQSGAMPSYSGNQGSGDGGGFLGTMDETPYSGGSNFNDGFGGYSGQSMMA